MACAEIPPRATREEEAPKRIDENLWRMREEAEILEETVAQLLPVRSALPFGGRMTDRRAIEAAGQLEHSHGDELPAQ